MPTRGLPNAVSVVKGRRGKQRVKKARSQQAARRREKREAQALREAQANARLV